MGIDQIGQINKTNFDNKCTGGIFPPFSLKTFIAVNTGIFIYVLSKLGLFSK